MWILLSLGTALCAGTSDALAKKAVQTERPLTVSLLRALWGGLFLLPFLFFGAPPSDPRAFYVSIACALPLEIAASFALQTALQSSPLSVCIPFMAFTPVFLVVTGWIFLGERVSALGASGVMLVAMGALILYRRGTVSAAEKGGMKGPLLVLFVAFLFSLTSIFAKNALLASSPFTFCGTYYLAVALCLLPFQMGRMKELIGRPKLFVGMGIAEASSFLFQFHAFLFAPVAYVLAIKRLSLLVSVVYGRVLFHERNLTARAAGAFVMAAGAAMLAFAC